MYEILARVASTRSGEVWQARDTALDRLVALKEVAPSAAEREAAALAALASEHVVQIFGVVHDGARSYLVEEWVDGATLGVVARAAGRLSAQQSLGVVRGALLGLAAAHAAGLVHGDVSFSNILVDGSGRARLIDFGSVARVGERAREATGAFAAPEVRAGGAVSPATDVYAAAAVLAALLDDEADFRPVLAKARAEVPADRYRDAAEFLRALEEAAERRYGAAWWTSAGLGTVATGSAATLLPPGAGAPLAGGGTTAASPMGAAAAPSSFAVQPGAAMARSSRRPLLVGGAVVTVLAVAVIGAVLASGDDEPAETARQTPSIGSTATGVPIRPSSSTGPTGPTTGTTPAALAPLTVDPCTLLDAGTATRIANAIGGEYKVVGAPRVSRTVSMPLSRQCDFRWSKQRTADGSADSGPVGVTVHVSRTDPQYADSTCSLQGSSDRRRLDVGDAASASPESGCAVNQYVYVELGYGGAIGERTTATPGMFTGPLRTALARAGTG